MVLSHCTLSQYLLSLYEVSTKSLEQIWTYVPDKKIYEREIIQNVSKVELLFLYTALPLSMSFISSLFWSYAPDKKI